MPTKPALRKSSKKPEIPLEFVWGTFCRQILQDPINQEATLVGVLPGLTLEIKAPNEQNEFEIPVVLWCHAVFRRTDDSLKPISVKVSAMVSQEYREPMLKELTMELKAGNPFVNLNLQLIMNSPGRGLLLKPGEQVLKASFRFKKTNVGTIHLPLDVKKTLSDTEES